MPHSFAICSRQLAADSSCIAADNCYPKFTDNQPNLFIICNDLLFPLYESLDHVEGALYGPKERFEEDGYFTTNHFECARDLLFEFRG